MVTGKSFDETRVNAMIELADLVLAHNSGFDRKFLEKRFPLLEKKAWACTMEQIEWQREGATARSLDYLLFKIAGLFFPDAHRALNDAEATLGLLMTTLPVSGSTVFQELLDASRETTCRIAAIGAPYDSKEKLKARGYRWRDIPGKPKGWWKDVAYSTEREEISYLANEIYPGGNTKSVEISRIDASTRFSTRE